MQLSQDDKKTLQAHEESRNIMEEKIYRQSSNEYEERSGSPRMGMFTEEEKWINASQLKETKIEKIEDGLLDRAVNEKDRFFLP